MNTINGMLSLVLFPLFPLIKGEDGWKDTVWKDHKECKIEEACLDDEQHCESNMTLKNLENKEELVIIDLTTYFPQERKIDQGVLKSYIEEICDIAFVTNREGEDCMVIRTPNRCEWRPISDNYCSHVRTMDSNPFGEFSKDCSLSPGWTGIMNTTRGQDGTYKLNWASLVKNPRCVLGILLVDEAANLEKDFWGTFNDVTFPIEYLKSTCNMKIRISYFRTYPGNEISAEKEYSAYPQCFEFDTIVDCEPTTDYSTIGITIAIICVVIVVIPVITRIVKSKKQRDNEANPKKVEELNDQYGTYYEGTEYNTANDNNPRYNEDGSNYDAVITDENIYYSRLNQNVGDNDATSPNGNIYYQL